MNWKEIGIFMFNCNGKTWLNLNYEYLSYENYGILHQKKEKKTCYIMMKEYYEIWVGKIIALNGEKNEKKILHYMSKEKNWKIRQLYCLLPVELRTR